MQPYEENVFFFFKCYLSFNPYLDNTTELNKQFCPLKLSASQLCATGNVYPTPTQVWGGLASNLNSVRLRFTAASWKIGIPLSHFNSHQFRINLLNMPHRIWRKISQIM